MNFLKKGPQLKFSEIKVPGLLQDLYHDLRERHLLPVAAVLLVGIVAVPFVFGHSPNSPKPRTAEGEASISSEAATASRALVARSMPGLRRYQQRLDHLRAKDPFKPRVAEPEPEPESESTGAGSSSSASVSETGSAGAETSAPTESGGASTETIPPTETGTETSPGTESEPIPGAGRLRYFSYAIDVRVATGGDSGQSAESQAETDSAPNSSSSSNSERRWSTRHNLPELTMLPSRTTPAIVYMGSTKDAKKALMLVSSDVTAVFGDGKCVVGSQTCQLLAMEPGVPETFVYGPAGRTFTIELLQVHLVETKKLNVAPLGKPKKHGKGNG